MKVLHYIPSIGRNSGGVGAYLRLLCHDLGKLCDLHIVTHRSADEEPLHPCTLHHIPCLRGAQMLGAIVTGGRYGGAAKREFLRVLDEVKPDVVHCNACWDPIDAYVVHWAKERGYAVALSPHGMLEPWDIKKNYWTRKLPAILLYQRRVVRAAHCLVATAESEAENLRRLGWNKRVEVVPNGIVAEGVEIKKEWKRRKQIIMMSLLRPNKGGDLLIQTVARMRQELEGWRVLIVGPDTEGYAATLQKLIEQEQVSHIVQLYGSAFGEEKWKLLRESDLFVLPTLNENFGIVVCEAYLCGTPVVITKGAPWEILEQERIGWWVERTTESLMCAIRSFLTLSETEVHEKGERGRHIIIEEFASEKVARRMMNVYSTLKSER